MCIPQSSLAPERSEGLWVRHKLRYQPTPQYTFCDQLQQTNLSAHKTTKNGENPLAHVC